MRGKVQSWTMRSSTSRITPAYAGKSRIYILGREKGLDHPRVCGEKGMLDIYPNSRQGSPPRMRGKEFSFEIAVLLAGITPAYAGKRNFAGAAVNLDRDHPRVCGEKPGVSTFLPVRLGITPAYAGKRLKRSHSIGHFSCILRLFHSVLHRASASGGSRAGPCAPPCLPAQNAVPV